MPNSVKARLKKLEERVVAIGPSGRSEKVFYLLISHEQYEEAMAIVNPSGNAVEQRSRLVLHEKDWRNNDQLVIVELER
jgi:hypothetical protein